MMNQAGFRTFLKRAGKREHVIDGLVNQVRAFEKSLGRADLHDATAQNIRDYAMSLSQSDAKKAMRGVALYFRFMGNVSLAKLSSGIREGEIATTRKEFKLGDFRGVNPDHIDKLAAIGIITVKDMLAAGSTPDARSQLVRRSRIPQKAILELVKLSDISRLGALKSVRARLYYDAGLDTPEKFAAWEPEKLRLMLVKFVASSGFDGIAPLPKEVHNAVMKARQLPKIVQY